MRTWLRVFLSVVCFVPHMLHMSTLHVLQKCSTSWSVHPIKHSARSLSFNAASSSYHLVEPEERGASHANVKRDLEFVKRDLQSVKRSLWKRRAWHRRGVGTYRWQPFSTSMYLHHWSLVRKLPSHHLSLVNARGWLDSKLAVISSHSRHRILSGLQDRYAWMHACEYKQYKMSDQYALVEGVRGWPAFVVLTPKDSIDSIDFLLFSFDLDGWLRPDTAVCSPKV